MQINGKMEKINKKNLLNHEYSEWEINKFQKCVKDVKGKRYFINIDYYDLTKELKGYRIPESIMKGFVCSFQFQNTHLFKSNICPNFKIDVTVSDLLTIEHYIHLMWVASKCPYYEEFC